MNRVLSHVLVNLLLFSAIDVNGQNAVPALEDLVGMTAKLEALRATEEGARPWEREQEKLALANQILELDPDNAVAHLELGTRNLQPPYFVIEDSVLGDAALHLEKALDSAPGRREAYIDLMRVYALQGNYSDALPRIRNMIENFPNDPAPRLFLGLASHRLGNSDLAARAFRAALKRMAPDERAVYLDLARVRSPRADILVSEREIHTFWRTRNQRLLTHVNERKVEHYTRLTLADLLFRNRIHPGRRGWNTEMGDIYVRYGPPTFPNSRVRKDPWETGEAARAFAARTGSGTVKALPMGSQRWDYGDFQFRFVDAFRNGEYVLYSPPSYAFENPRSRRDPLDDDYVLKARETIRETPEQYNYNAPGRVEAPFRLAAFRGKNGMADLYLSYGIPLAGKAGTGRQDQDVEIGVNTGAFLLQDGLPVAERRRPFDRLRGSQIVELDSLRLWANVEALLARPGTYEVAFEFEAENQSVWAANRKPIEVPDFSRNKLTMSEILLAYGIEPGRTEQPGTILREGLIIQPAPWDVYGTDDPIYLYFEIYGLGMTVGQTNYEVEAELRPKDDRGFFERIFRGREPGVSNAFPVLADRQDDSQYVILDATGQAPGEYTLTVRVEDLVSGQAVERETSLFLE